MSANRTYTVEDMHHTIFVKQGSRDAAVKAAIEISIDLPITVYVWKNSYRCCIKAIENGKEI
jgi:hypothetical protein